MEQSIEIMVNRIASILNDNQPSIMLFGSVTRDDFKLGWSDIDFICLTNKIMNDTQANQLVNLRQILLEENAGNPYFRLFEGGIMTLDAFLNKTDDTVIYWGTSGQKITNSWDLCTFGKIELLENGKLLFGNDFRHLILPPTRIEIINEITRTCETIKKFGIKYPSMGWLLDTARCLYTLKTNKIISKTMAGEWAMNQSLCPDISILEKIIEIRKNPMKYRACLERRIWNEEINEWEKTLAPYTKRFVNVLDTELRTYSRLYIN
ncbi:MAG: DUF4111 domain-containing protein [Defluviitaleaceae bacterium]|nr:DUF4111 domain-containing protein [Defluviitaleaceae bacterium]MCL2274363.1 DUF4111 domain-containing protein [Defluviitaleaceae bacterium]